MRKIVIDGNVKLEFPVVLLVDPVDFNPEDSFHFVRRGDVVYLISLKHSVEVAKIHDPKGLLEYVRDDEVIEKVIWLYRDEYVKKYGAVVAHWSRFFRKEDSFDYNTTKFTLGVLWLGIWLFILGMWFYVDYMWVFGVAVLVVSGLLTGAIILDILDCAKEEHYMVLVKKFIK